MCFGVRDAIALALEHADRAPVTILGELVHNETVLASLRERGVQYAANAESVATRNVMVTAHGASDRAINRARALGLNVVEATCPLVHHAHAALRKLAAAGFHPVVIGRRDHVEVRGLTEDLETFDVVLTEADVAQLQERPRFGVVAQTTQAIEKVRQIVALIEKRFPRSEVRFSDTVCQPTKQRQTAAIQLARQCDVVIVIGGANSNNTRELVATCGRFCKHVRHVQTAADLRLDWFQDGDVVGITAGTSTPDSLIHEVESWLEGASDGATTPADSEGFTDVARRESRQPETVGDRG